MGFKPISMENYLKKYLAINKNADKNEIETKLNIALTSYQMGFKCSCGNDIWVIASAFIGNCCYTCLTGKSESDNDLEIDSAIVKIQKDDYSTDNDIMDCFDFFKLYDDDGTEINRDLIKKPSLCLLCIHDENKYESINCDLTRYDQRNKEEFVCFAFVKKVL